MSRVTPKAGRPSARFWIVAVFLTIVFLTGGSSRTDAQSLAILRPLSVFLCAAACISLTRKDIYQHRVLLICFAAMFVLAVLHIIPLPPEMWHTLSGRSDVKAIDAMIGIDAVWRPLTLTPANGWHALLSLFTPLAVLLFAIQLNRNDLTRLLPVVIALATLSGFLGLLQIIGDPSGPLYFYRITNNGSAVGLFANRNHAAVLLGCLFPMLSAFASTAQGTADQQKQRMLVAAAVAIVLIPLILVTGSRSGLIVSIFGLILGAILFRRPVSGRIVRRGDTGFRFGAVPIFAGIAVVSLGLISYIFSRAEAIDRLFTSSAGDDSRTEFWAASIDMFWKYFPLGSGSGSFVEAYQIIEPQHLLNETYLNHAHNDWIEIAVTYGIPGILLLALAVILYLKRSFAIWSNSNGTGQSIAFSRMAGICIAMLGFASAADYPLRTPTLMCVFAILWLWFAEKRLDRSDVSTISRERG